MDRTREYLAEVARWGSISKAARQLCITPAALSKFVIQRESEWGLKLFNREGKQFTLTFAGERYLELLGQIEESRQKMQEEMRWISDLYMGKLRIGIQRSLAETVVKQILPRLMDRYRNIPFSILEGNTADMKNRLLHNELDIILVTSEEAEETELRREPICGASVVLVGKRDPEMLAGARGREGFSYPWLSDEQVCELEFLDRESDWIRRYLPHLYERIAAANSRQRVIARGARTILLCAEAGLGVSLLPDLLVRELNFTDRVQMYSCGPQERKMWLSVYFPPQSLLQDEIACFVDVARECFGEEDP